MAKMDINGLIGVEYFDPTNILDMYVFYILPM